VILELRKVHVTYDGPTILNGITWEVRKGEHWALLGPNGAGKTTLLSLILADNPQAYANHVVLFGKQRGSGETIWISRAASAGSHPSSTSITPGGFPAWMWSAPVSSTPWASIEESHPISAGSQNPVARSGNGRSRGKDVRQHLPWGTAHGTPGPRPRQNAAAPGAGRTLPGTGRKNTGAGSSIRWTASAGREKPPSSM